MEKIPPLYNKDGQVNDPDVAMSMAKTENPYHREDAQKIRDRNSDMNDQEYKQAIDEEVEDTGKTEHALKNLPVLIEKIRTALSPEELEMFRTAAHAYASEYLRNTDYKDLGNGPFEKILFEIIKK
jgi:hypothetical protein